MVSMILLATWNSTCWDRLAGALKCNIYIYTCICAPTHDIYRFGMIPHDWYLLDGLKLPAGSNVAGSSTRSTSSAGCAAFLFGNPGGGVWCSNDVWYYAGSVPCIIAYYHIIILLHFSEWIPQKQWVYLCNHWINMMYLRFQIVVVIVLVMCGHDMTWHDMTCATGVQKKSKSTPFCQAAQIHGAAAAKAVPNLVPGRTNKIWSEWSESKAWHQIMRLRLWDVDQRFAIVFGCIMMYFIIYI